MGICGVAGTGSGMATEPAASGLGEALASYQPRSMTAEMWARFRNDAIALTLRVYPTPGRHRVVCLGHLTLFLADMAESHPEAGLLDLLTRDQVEGYFSRLRREGLAPSTLRGRQSALNRFLTGGNDRADASWSLSTPSQPYDPAVLKDLLREAIADGSRAALDFARLMLCGWPGTVSRPSPPTRTWRSRARPCSWTGSPLRFLPMSPCRRVAASIQLQPVVGAGGPSGGWGSPRAAAPALQLRGRRRCVPARPRPSR